MSTFERSVRLAVLGWALVIVFAALVSFGKDGVAGGAVYATVGVVMGSWVWLRHSRPALVVSLVIGVLQSIEQAGYVVGDVSDGDAALAGADLVGLVAGLCIVTGSTLALRSLRSHQAVKTAAV